MSGLDVRYSPLISIQQYIVDKDTGLPLAAGKVSFFKDNARTAVKEVFKLSGAVPNYFYESVGSVLTLSASGTFIDEDGNDFIPYVFPYDENGAVDLYYIIVESSEDVLQFTREAVPNIGFIQDDSGGNDFINYIPNGQFFIHRALPNSGAIAGDSTYVAYGNFIFERSTGSTSTDFFTFERVTSFVQNPTGSPRYECRIKCTAPHVGDTVKKLKVRFQDVNKFSSDSQVFTFSFNAKSNNSNNTLVNFSITKDFGDGTIITTPVQTGILIGTSNLVYTIPFVFGSNSGQSIGAGDSDSVSLNIEFPVSYEFDIKLANFVLTQGNVSISSFPTTTQRQFAYETLPIPIPNPDGSDLFCPVVIGQEGPQYSHKEIGSIVDSLRATAIENCMILDGTQLDADAYAPNGVPYKRLRDVLHAAGLCVGMEFVSLKTMDNGGGIFISNKGGATQPPIDGVIPTGFVFSQINDGVEIGFIADTNGIDISCSDESIGANGGIVGSGTTGFTVVIKQEDNVALNIAQITQISITDVTGLQGAYCLISSPTTQYYPWFAVDGVGSDPAPDPAYVGRLMAISSSYTATEVTSIFNNMLNGRYQSAVTCVPAASLTPGAYFQFFNQNYDKFVVYYTINGVGDMPAVSGANKFFNIDLTGSETADEVWEKTGDIVNISLYSIPDYRGFFRRTWLRTADINRDPDTGSRYSYYGSLPGNNLGSWQHSDLLLHYHSTRQLAGFIGADSGGLMMWNGEIYANTTGYGGADTRPFNVYVNTFIIY